MTFNSISIIIPEFSAAGNNFFKLQRATIFHPKKSQFSGIEPLTGQNLISFEPEFYKSLKLATLDRCCSAELFLGNRQTTRRAVTYRRCGDRISTRTFMFRNLPPLRARVSTSGQITEHVRRHFKLFHNSELPDSRTSKPDEAKLSSGLYVHLAPPSFKP